MTENTQEPVYASKSRPWLKYYDKRYIDQSLPECTAFELVCRNNAQHLRDTALEYYGRKVRYADFIVQVKKTAAALRGLGGEKGDILTVVSVMTPEVIYTFYAADLLGATLNLIDPRYSAEGIREYLREVGSCLLLCLSAAYPRCQQAIKHTNIERVVVLSPADSLPPHKALAYRLANPDKTTTPPTCCTGGSSLPPARGKVPPPSPTTRSTPVWWCAPAAPPARPRALC